MWAYWTLLTDRRPAEIEEMKASVAAGTLHPKKLKMDLGLQIVSDFHGQAAAFAAQEEFERRFAGAGGAVSAEEMSLGKMFPGEENSFERNMADVLVAAGLAPSKNVARQKIKEGAVSTSSDGQTWKKIESPAEMLRLAAGDGVFLRMGKKFVRVKP
jgi:tyrosyl-tRNA synthetase